jgi:hypothetical protein
MQVRLFAFLELNGLVKFNPTQLGQLAHGNDMPTRHKIIDLIF